MKQPLIDQKKPYASHPLFQEDLENAGPFNQSFQGGRQTRSSELCLIFSHGGLDLGFDL